MNTKIDARLLALYNEYLENNKEYEFINMLYAILDQSKFETRRKVMHDRAVQKRKESAEERKTTRAKIEAFFASMTPEELIQYQNTPYEQLPEWLKEAMSKIVQNPESCNFVRIYDLVRKGERQQEIAASRLTRYMENHGLITTFEGETTLHYEKFSEICNELAAKYDLSWGPGQKAQRVRITPRDLKNYTQCRVTPKGDKLAVLAAVTDLPVWYLCGYGKAEEPPKTNKHPLTSRFSKKAPKAA